MTLEDTARQAYAASRDLLGRPEMAEVVTGGLTILYGPPIARPNLFLISFQGGGASPVVFDTWPGRLLYLDDEFKPGNEFKFGRNLCRYARQAGIYPMLEKSTVAVPAVFPGEKSGGAAMWQAKTGVRSQWRVFSVAWVEKMVDAANPKAVVVFGGKTSGALGLDGTWHSVEHKHASGFMTYGQSKYRGVPAVFSGHLSQGYVASEVVRSLRAARSIVEGNTK